MGKNNITYCVLNGRLMPEAEAHLPISDLAIRRGYGIFDFFRSKNQIGFFMDASVQRFLRSAQKLNIKLPYDADQIMALIQQLMDKNQIIESGLRLIATGGVSDDAYTPTKPNFMITEAPIHFPADEYYQKGVHLMLFEFQRELASIKSINYITPISLLEQTQKLGCYDVLYHFNNEVLEVSRSNFFIVKNGTIITANKGILEGITRSNVIALCAENYKIEKRAFTVDELFDADEAFMTGTTKKVLAVTKVDSRPIGNGAVGPVTKQLMQRFDLFEANYYKTAKKFIAG